ncbi:unnamed protein product [Hermetia illucens]|uniref:Ionotropic receptor n=1 Tax=Hermetia illucens TaxID=343691 RepID=A0A7R8UWN3_HERIL|nr:unnamed protein product [Hermetia illucens]
MNLTNLDQICIAECYLSNLLNQIVQVYMLGLYSVCILWNSRWDYDFASDLHWQDMAQVVSLKVELVSKFKVDLQQGMEQNYCQDHKEGENVETVEGSDNNGTYLDGTEGALMLSFCKKHNCTLHLFIGNKQIMPQLTIINYFFKLITEEAAEWGDAYPNFTGTGLLGNLVERKVEVIACALYLWYSYYPYFQYSSVISRTGITAVVPVPNYEEAIDTKEQLAEKQQLWGATSEAWVNSIDGTEQFVEKTLVRNFRNLSREDLYQRGLTGKFGFSIERLSYGHFAAGDYITTETMQHLQRMLHDIYYEYCLLMSFKTWPLIEHFNSFILRVQQSGIQSVMEQNAVNRYSNVQVQLQIAIKRENRKTNEPRALGIPDILGVLMVLVFGLTLSLMVFIFEIFKYRIENPTRNQY